MGRFRPSIGAVGVVFFFTTVPNMLAPDKSTIREVHQGGCCICHSLELERSLPPGKGRQNPALPPPKKKHLKALKTPFFFHPSRPPFSKISMPCTKNFQHSLAMPGCLVYFPPRLWVCSIDSIGGGGHFPLSPNQPVTFQAPVTAFYPPPRKAPTLSTRLKVAKGQRVFG